MNFDINKKSKYRTRIILYVSDFHYKQQKRINVKYQNKLLSNYVKKIRLLMKI